MGADTGLLEGRGKETFMEGLWYNNPMAVQVLGICPALAVTNKLSTSVVMAGAVFFVMTGTTTIVSLLRRAIPQRVRLITQMAIISTLVILVDQSLKAFMFPISKQLGPYVALIITNCTILGRSEGFGLQNPVPLSALDGASNALGYGLLLMLLGASRELLGSGQLTLSKGNVLLTVGHWYEPNHLMVLAPGAFFALGFLVAAYKAIKGPEEEEEETP
jgi:Na+-transporting NADH:ubiquinone oxidoreductase subunit D